MKKIFVFFLYLFICEGILAQNNIKTDTKAVAVLNKFMNALMIEDADASAQEVMKYTHISLHNGDRTDLTQDLRSFSFKKAHDNAKFYQIPVKITRVRETKVSAIGYDETAQKGKVIDYFVAKKAGVNGMPAPVKIFFPADGSEPKISYMGSL